MNTLCLEKVLNLKKRLSHFDSQRLCLGGTGNNTSVVVGKNYHWLIFQLGIKYLFAGCVEVVAINEGNDFFLVHEDILMEG